jgi:hypothetical protein
VIGSFRACALVAALVSGVGAAACDGDASSSSSGANDRIKNACGLLTTHEVTAFMGTPMHGGEQDTDRTIPGTYCTWTSKDYVGEEQENPDYSIFVDEASTDERRNGFEGRENAKRPETVRGLGDGAYFYNKGTALVPFLELRVGDRIMTVGVSGNDLHPVTDDEAKRLERTAAELIVQRLKPRGESSR